VRDRVVGEADLRGEILAQVVRELRSDARVDREARIHLPEAEEGQLEPVGLAERPSFDDVNALHLARLLGGDGGSDDE